MACARFPPLAGGTEVHVANVGASLADRGHDVTVYTTVLDPADVGESVVGQMRVVRLRAWPSGSDLHATPGLRSRLRHGAYELIHVQGYHTLVAPTAMSAALAADVPLVVSFHSGGHSSRIRRALRPAQHAVLRRQLARADRLVAVSDWERESFQRRLRLDPDRFVTVTNGVDDAFVEVPIAPASTLVSSFGRLEEYKGHHLVIEALVNVVDAFPEATLRIVGTGPYESELRSLVLERGLSKVVEFTSVAPDDRATAAKRMSESHVVALASRYESQGLVGLEALAAGARLVVMAGSALDELAEHEAVRVVERHSVLALSEAICAQLSSPRPDRTPELPTWDRVADRLEVLYEEVLRDRRVDRSRSGPRGASGVADH